ncbi:hypothetical protein [Lysinibacillus sp. G4S2]|nr:hypothetical protein [Lysinibacillus sp. G4S2]MDM5250031.1 hypothetical protein [Lysinibacillus sp. G4S2]
MDKVNQIVVRIVAEHIVNNGTNPKTEQTYSIDDVTNEASFCC